MSDQFDNALDFRRGRKSDDDEDRARSRADATPREHPPRSPRAEAANQRGRSGPEEAGAEPCKQPNRPRWPLIALAIVIVIGAIGGTTYWYLAKDQQSTDDAYTDGRAVTISPHVSGYVTVLAVNDNQFVHKGDLLVQIEPKDYEAAREQAEGQLKALEAQLDNARLALDKARVDYPAQLSQAEGQLRQARANCSRRSRSFPGSWE